jgi:hypothetical protein
MAHPESDYDWPEEELGITFGIGIDCEAQYQCFSLYADAGGQEEQRAEEPWHGSIDRVTFAVRALLR